MNILSPATLTFRKSHICNIASQISKSIGISFRSSFFLSKSSLCMLYNSMILPYLNYCNPVWGSNYKTNLQRIVILQKRVIRKSKSNYDAHTDPIFNNLDLLKFHGIHLVELQSVAKVLARTYSIQRAKYF